MTKEVWAEKFGKSSYVNKICPVCGSNLIRYISGAYNYTFRCERCSTFLNNKDFEPYIGKHEKR